MKDARIQGEGSRPKPSGFAPAMRRTGSVIGTILILAGLPALLSAHGTSAETATPNAAGDPAGGAAEQLPSSAEPTLSWLTGISPLVRLSLDLQAGLDDDLLADPEGLGELEPISASFLTLGPNLSLRRAGVFSSRARDRLDAALGGWVSGYSEGTVGPETDLRGDMSYRWTWREGVLLEGSASMLHFRRRNLPVFDLDLPALGLRAARTAGRKWLLGCKAVYARPSYPGRELDAGGTQRDHRVEAMATVLRSAGAGGFATLGAGWRENESNDALADFRGPLVEIRAQRGDGSKFLLSAAAAYGQRDYRGYPVLATIGADTVDTGENRRDVTWQVAVSAEKAVNGRLRLFATGLYTHQTSNVDALAYDQSRFSAGVRLQLWQRGSEGGPGLVLLPGRVREDPVAPEVTPEGVRFQVRAPRAERVALVGGFNAWNEGATPMRGPDAAGLWEVTLPLPAGIWRYAFVLDGKWTRPEGAPRYEPDGFGGENGVLDLERPAGPVSGP